MYQKGLHSCSRLRKGCHLGEKKTGILKGKGLSLGAEPPCIKLYC